MKPRSGSSRPRTKSCTSPIIPLLSFAPVQPSKAPCQRQTRRPDPAGPHNYSYPFALCRAGTVAYFSATVSALLSRSSPRRSEGVDRLLRCTNCLCLPPQLAPTWLQSSRWLRFFIVSSLAREERGADEGAQGEKVMLVMRAPCANQSKVCMRTTGEARKARSFELRRSFIADGKFELPSKAGPVLLRWCSWGTSAVQALSPMHTR